jgi:outer membrane protein assembly factor BamA
LGLYDSVTLRLAPPDQATRDALFELKPAKQTEVSLLFGFGTYELLRGGIEIQQRDILGLADSSQLRLSQSFKTSSAYYVFTLPDLIAPDVNLFFDAEALRRQELSFLRQEYGGGVGAEKYLRDIGADLSVRYEYQLLTASQITIDPADGLATALDSAFIFDIKHDERDNPLYPHHGYKVFANLEVASRDFGGEVNYERYDIATSYHLPIGSGHWLHLGLEDGAVFTDRGPRLDLPFNKRFFPGGENSIRGYTEGQAAPRDAAGNLVGAETFLLGTVELEQELTSKLSAVAFLDSLGEARRIQNFPFDEVLYSVGGGLGWRTLIGPVRLEYGHNLNRRRGDPSGTIQFSVGFPF